MSSSLKFIQPVGVLFTACKVPSLAGSAVATSSEIDVRRTEVDGIPTYWLPAPGPLMAGIVFRVGRVDETLPTGGITHLTEHLALFPFGSQTYSYNGTVEGNRTMFFAAGSEAQVSDFLERTCESLWKLQAADRIVTERRILMTEGQSRPDSIAEALFRMRYGTAGHGLAGYEEFGLFWLKANDVEDWATRYFTRGNAALWLTGEPPGDLKLPLPDGERKPVPPPIVQLPTLPAFVSKSIGGVAISMTGERSAAFGIGLTIASTRLQQKLRYEHGLTYSIAAGYERLTETVAHAILIADCLKEHGTRVRDELLACFKDLASTGPTTEEMQDVIDSAEQSWTAPQTHPNLLDSMATNHVVGAPIMSVDEQLEEMRAATPADVAAAIGECYSSHLLIVPEGVTGGDGQTEFPVKTQESLPGKTYRPKGYLNDPSLKHIKLTVGPTGISLTRAKNDVISIPFSECTALLRIPGGTRMIWGRDGSVVEINPEAWSRGSQIEDTVDQGVDRDLVVRVRADDWKALHPDADVLEPEIPALWERAAARLIDGVIMVILWFIGAQLLDVEIVTTNTFLQIAFTLLGMAFFFGPAVYEILLLAFEGRTPGKMLMQMKVVDVTDRESKPTFRYAFLRTLALAGHIFPLVLLIGLVHFGTDRKYRRGLHDQWGQTLVVKETSSEGHLT